MRVPGLSQNVLLIMWPLVHYTYLHVIAACLCRRCSAVVPRCYVYKEVTLNRFLLRFPPFSNKKLKYHNTCNESAQNWSTSNGINPDHYGADV